MGKSDAPPPPDYKGAAIAQGQANKEAAQFDAGMNRPNEHSADGSRTWSLRPGADPDNPVAGDWQVNTNLSAGNQQLYDMEQKNKLDMGQLANKMTGTVDSALAQPMDLSGAPQAGQAVQAQGIGAGPQLQGSTVMPYQYSTANQATPGRQFDATAYSADREKVSQNLFDSMTRRTEGQFQQQEAQTRDRLVNQGLDERSQAFQDEMGKLDVSRNDAYGEAARQAELAGGQEQTRIDTSQNQAFGQQLGSSDSNFGQRTGADSQNFQQLLASMQENFGQKAQATDSNFSRGLASNSQNFNQKVTESASNSAARNQYLQEQAYLRSLPLNEINAVRSSSQVAAPQFQNYATGMAAAPADLLGATTQGYQANVAATNANNAASGATAGAVGSTAMAGVALYMF